MEETDAYVETDEWDAFETGIPSSTMPVPAYLEPVEGSGRYAIVNASDAADCAADPCTLTVTQQVRQSFQVVGFAAGPGGYAFFDAVQDHGQLEGVAFD